jgi:hypothetical protein
MGGVVVSNAQLEDALNWWVDTWMDSGATLEVFENDFTPDPATELGDFVPATFGGYASVSLSGQWGASMKVIDGKYQRDSAEFTFTCTAAPTLDVYGWYVYLGSGAGALRMSGRFPAPISMAIGVVFKITLSPQSWSLSIIEE